MSALTPMDDFFPEFFRRLSSTPAFDIDRAPEIRLDVNETDKAFIVRAEVPGARKSDVRVEIDGNVLTIGAHLAGDVDEAKVDGERSLLRETWRGDIRRTVSLPADVDDKAAVAKLEDGVLRLTLPKSGNDSAKVLAIQ
jgi:HSP20 family protein